MMNTSIFRTIALWLTLVLGGCGAGGDVNQIATTGLSITQFVGIWQNNNPNPVCQPSVIGGYYSEGVTRLTGETYIETYDYYTDSNCTTYLGSTVNIFDISWSIPTSSATKTGAMRAVISNLRYSATGEIRASEVAPDPSISYKVLFYVENNGLSSYFDVVTPSQLLDADGYPLGLDQPLFTYTRTNLSDR
jgi:hypothetical protein